MFAAMKFSSSPKFRPREPSAERRPGDDGGSRGDCGGDAAGSDLGESGGDLGGVVAAGALPPRYESC